MTRGLKGAIVYAEDEAAARIQAERVFRMHREPYREPNIRHFWSYFSYTFADKPFFESGHPVDSSLGILRDYNLRWTYNHPTTKEARLVPAVLPAGSEVARDLYRILLDESKTICYSYLYDLQQNIKQDVSYKELFELCDQAEGGDSYEETHFQIARRFIMDLEREANLFDHHGEPILFPSSLERILRNEITYFLLDNSGRIASNIAGKKTRLHEDFYVANELPLWTVFADTETDCGSQRIEWLRLSGPEPLASEKMVEEGRAVTGSSTRNFGEL